MAIMSARTTGVVDGDGGFDQVIERLRTVVERLEAGNLSLEESLAAFEEGVRLSRRGTEMLDRAERRVEVLQRGEDGEKVAPFAVAPGEGEGGAS
jgi:exodeoxyribonuclease VII small subunit